MKKNTLQLHLSCTSAEAVSIWLDAVKQFVVLVKQNSNPIFKAHILEYFNAWTSVIQELESSVVILEVMVHIQEVKKGLKVILNEEKDEPKWQKGVEGIQASVISVEVFKV